MNRSHRGAQSEPLERRLLLTGGGVDRLVSTNGGAGGGTGGTGAFTQTDAAIVATGNTIVTAFTDSGAGLGANHFTGYSRSSDGGGSFADQNVPLPTSTNGDAGKPMMVRDETTGRIYLATTSFTGQRPIQVFRSDNNGASWLPAVSATAAFPGETDDNPCIAIDNFPGPGRGNVFVAAQRFEPASGHDVIVLFRSTNGGDSFGPSTGLHLSSGSAPAQGPSVVVTPNHGVHVFWLAGGKIFACRSTDGGQTFSAAFSIASGLPTTDNGDLGLTGQRSGTATRAPFASNCFPRAAVNPITGDIYVVFGSDRDGPGIGDGGDIYFTQSTNNGLSYSARIFVNDPNPASDQWNPSIAVTPDGKHVGFFYYSRQEDSAANNLYRLYGRIAVTWNSTLVFEDSVPISDDASLPEFGRDSALADAAYFATRNTVATTNNTFHIVWSDSRSDLPGGAGRKDPNIYYDKVTVGNTAVWTGSGDHIRWSDPNNWTDSFVPGPGHDVYIGSGFGTIFIAAGSFTINSLEANSPLSFVSGGLTIEGNGGVARVRSITLDASSMLDLGNNDLIIDYAGASPLADVVNQIRTARANGAWTGPGIASFAARYATPRNTTLGVLEATEFKALYGPDARFGGQLTDNTAVLVKYTYYGDTDFNGVVNFDDYARIDTGFITARTGWLNGDFDGNGVVNFDDYSLIDLAFNSQNPVATATFDRRRLKAP